MPVQKMSKLLQKKEIGKGIYHFTVEAPEIAQIAKPGNFIEIRVNQNSDPFLRRPISLYQIDSQKGSIEFIFQVKGKGTQILSQKQIGEEIDLVGPLGHGTFKFENAQKIAILGGGIGVFPLYELAKQAKKAGKQVSIYLGYRNKEAVVLEEEFKQVADKLVITTDDGSYGQKGFAIEVLKQDIENETVDCLYSCGPLPMLKAVQKLAEEKQIECQISLEEKMACGLGACLGCAVKIAKSPKEAPEYWHVCKAGPVFNSNLVEI